MDISRVAAIGAGRGCGTGLGVLSFPAPLVFIRTWARVEGLFRRTGKNESTPWEVQLRCIVLFRP